MRFKLLSVIGILVAVVCFCEATALYQGGYDWSRDYISTLLRGPAGPARNLADAGVLIFCFSIAFVFGRLARASEFSKTSTAIRIAGIGSQVYAAITITPMHDLMVTISGLFSFVAILALMTTLYVRRDRVLFAGGCLCLAVLIVSAAIYYTGNYASILPWAQKAWLAVFTVWLTSLDFAYPRLHQQGDLQSTESP
jgi:hypothetical protein